MQFQVPQFIEVEDKIFGPFTFKQFIYMVGGVGIAFVIYKILTTFIAILLGLPIIALSLALAFYKVNGKPFIFIIESFVRYRLSHKLYLWKKEERKPEEKAASSTASIDSLVPKLSDSKLKDLSWSLDVLDVRKRNN